MIKNIIKIISIIIAILLILIFYLNIYGINTTQFNSFIKKEINSYNNQLDIELKKVKLILNLKDFSLSIKTLDPLLLYENQSIKLKELSTNLSIKAYLDKNFVIQKLFVKSDENEVKNLIKIYKSIKNSPQLYLLDKMFKKGLITANIIINFNEAGEINNDFSIYGTLTNTKIKFLNENNLNDLNFEFKIKKNNYILKNILFEFKDIGFESDQIKVNQKKGSYIINGNLKNNKNTINKNLISLFPSEYFEQFNFEKTSFNSDNNFSFNVNRKFKINDLKVNSKIYLDNLIYNNDSIKLKNYLPEYQGSISLNKNNFNINFSKNNLKIEGKSIYSLNEIDNNFSFNFNKIKNDIKFKTNINLNNHLTSILLLIGRFLISSSYLESILSKLYISIPLSLFSIRTV